MALKEPGCVSQPARNVRSFLPFHLVLRRRRGNRVRSLRPWGAVVPSHAASTLLWKRAAALREGSCAGTGSWRSLATWRINPGASIDPSAFPGQVPVLLQRRRYRPGREMKQTERCGCCGGLPRRGSPQSKRKGERARACVSPRLKLWQRAAGAAGSSVLCSPSLQALLAEERVPGEGCEDGLLDL